VRRRSSVAALSERRTYSFSSLRRSETAATTEETFANKSLEGRAGKPGAPSAALRVSSVTY
jgi:hypothetical protein